MDTFKDKPVLEDMHSRGGAPWEVWKNGQQASSLPKAIKLACDPKQQERVR